MHYKQRPDYFLCDMPPEATLTSNMVLEAIDTLQRNAVTFLHPRSIEQQVSLIEQLGKLWMDEMFPYRCELLNHCGGEIRFSREIFSHGLDEVFRTLSRERIYQLLRIELGNENALDGWHRHLQSEDAPAHSSHHFSFRLVGAHYRQSVPSQLIVFMVKCLLAKTSQWIVCSRETLEVARLFAHSVYQIDSKAAACIEVVDESLMDSHLGALTSECEFFRTWDYNLRSPLKQDRNFGFVWISRDYIRQNGLGRLIRNLANDITAWDQLYPHAPHVIFVQDRNEHDAEKIAELLLDELSDLNVEFPQAHYNEDSIRQINLYRNAYQMRAKSGPETLVFENGSDVSPGCSVIYDIDPQFAITLGNRFVFVKPASALEELLHVLEPYRSKIGCVGLALTPEESAPAARQLAFWGVPRICSAGVMHRPCIFREGGMAGLNELTYKSFWERTYNA